MPTPKTGPFYIVEGGAVFFTFLDIGHAELWRAIARWRFRHLDQSLLLACYGCDRGRVSFSDDVRQYILFGTPGCKKFAGQIKQLYDLDGIPRGKLCLNFCDDHYRLMSDDVKMLAVALKFEPMNPDHGNVFQYVEGGQFVRRL